MLLVFPDIAVDSSIHTAILVGLLVSWQLHERLGWAFAGFVVSGYLAALAMVSPPALVVVAVESALTFGVVRILTDGLPALGLYAPVFGRERFLLYVLASLPVRLACSGTAAPRFAAWCVRQGLADLDLEASLTGIGVVLVPLAANTLHKPGLVAGSVQVGVAAAATWLILAFGLAPFTNFALEGLSGSLDVLNTDATPPARTLLLLFVTAFVAAHNNLRYGWDFGGVLVPALLAVLALEPARMAATIAEVGWLYLAWRGLRAIPAVAALDLGGPRRIVSMYVVSWGLHLALAWVALWTDLPIVVGDSFGFGYLLTSLVVTRCVSAGAVRTVAPLVFTAGQGVLLASGLALVVASTGPGPAMAAGREAGPTEAVAAVELAEDALAGTPPPPAYGAAWAAEAATPVRGCAVAMGRQARVLRCRESGPVLVVAQPLQDPDSAWLSGWLAERLGAAAIVVAAADPAGHPFAVGVRGAVEAALADARAISGGAAVVAVETATGPTEVWRQGAAPVELLAALPSARLGVGAPGGPAWAALRPGEALVRVSPADVGGPSAAAPSDPVRAARTVIGALIRHGAALRGRPEAAQWLGGLAGASVWERPDGFEVTVADDRFVVRPGGAPWVVASEPELGVAAEWTAARLHAEVLWIGPLSAARRVRGGDGHTEVEALVRTLLPADSGRGAVALGGMPREVGAPAMTTAGPGDAGAWAAVGAAWPGATTGASVELELATPFPELAFRQAALGGAWIALHLTRSMAREGTADAESWWSERGVGARLEAVEGLPEAPPVAALQALADAPTEPALAAAQATGRVSVARVGPRRVVELRTPTHTCRAVAGGRREPSPGFSGCWGRR